MYSRKRDKYKQTRVFKLKFDHGEFDMVIHDPECATCRLFEIKHTTEREELRFLEGTAEHLTVNARLCIRISDKLLSSAGITNQMAFLGCVRYAKLWEP